HPSQQPKSPVGAIETFPGAFCFVCGLNPPFRFLPLERESPRGARGRIFKGDADLLQSLADGVGLKPDHSL
ncbi:MAG: hypothetical protein WBD05_01065, partial [Phycisphaerae bacterium]